MNSRLALKDNISGINPASPDLGTEGYTYSPWQLLDLRHILNEYELIRHGWHAGADPVRGADHAAGGLRAGRVVAALLVRRAWSALDAIRGEAGRAVALPARWPTRCNCWPRLALIPPTSAKKPSGLLGDAHGSDPLADWLPLIRHAGYQGLVKTKGSAAGLHVGADRCRGYFCAPTKTWPSLATWSRCPTSPSWTGAIALHDRITPRDGDGDSLERALGSFGLSPHPRVLLLVEGETELDHVPGCWPNLA